MHLSLGQQSNLKSPKKRSVGRYLRFVWKVSQKRAYQFFDRLVAVLVDIFEKLESVIGESIDNVDSDRRIHVMLNRMMARIEMLRSVERELTSGRGQLTDKESSPTLLLATPSMFGE